MAIIAPFNRKKTPMALAASFRRRPTGITASFQAERKTATQPTTNHQRNEPCEVD